MYSCKSVVSGWKTCIHETGETFGPSFNKIQDLWNWQRENIYDIEMDGIVIDYGVVEQKT
jgi:hypothetical protein